MFPEDIEEIEEWPAFLGDIGTWEEPPELDAYAELGIAAPIRSGVVGFLLGACCAGVLILSRRGCPGR